MTAYQADVAKFEQAGAQVLGISVDSQRKNKAFAEELSLHFPVLSDETKAVTRQYGVLMSVIHLARRTTFVIDKDGIIQQIQAGSEAIDPLNALPYCSLPKR